MECPKCGAEVDGEWRFCPNCGYDLSGSGGPGGRGGLGSEEGEEREDFGFGGEMFPSFGRIFVDMDKELERMRKMMERSNSDFEAYDLRPMFGQPKTSGFSVRISSTPGKEPEVSVKTFGDVRKEDLEKEMEQKFGIKRRAGMRGTLPEVVAQPREGLPAKVAARKAEKAVERKAPKITEEPKAKIEKCGNKVTVEMELPDVTSEKDIEVNELTNSIEVKAFAKDKAYFKILSVPANFSITGRQFSKGKLRLEIVS